MRVLGYRTSSPVRRRLAHSLAVLMAVLPFANVCIAQPLPQAPEPAQTQAAPADSPAAAQTSNPPVAPAQQPVTPQIQQNGTTAPLGTAAAPYEKGIGVAASRPAGAVIAPAKQRRTRSFLIKVSVILAAAVAVGTVVALSSASPSTPH